VRLRACWARWCCGERGRGVVRGGIGALREEADPAGVFWFVFPCLLMNYFSGQGASNSAATAAMENPFYSSPRA